MADEIYQQSWSELASRSDLDGQVAEDQGVLRTVTAAPTARATLFSGFRSELGKELTVVQRLDERRYRALPSRQRRAAFPPSVEDSVLSALGFAMSARPGRAALQTGIKVLDLLCPLPSTGTVAIFGGRSVGRTSLVYELHQRLARRSAGLVILFLVVPSDAHLVAKVAEDEAGFPPDVQDGIQTFWLSSDRAQSREYASGSSFIDARIFLDASKAAQGLFPAIDPLLSHSELLNTHELGARHIFLANSARSVLRESEQLITEFRFPRELAQAEFDAAKAQREGAFQRAWMEGDVKQRSILQRARRLELYLTQTFYCAERFTQRPGTTVPLSAALDDLERILSGDLDTEPESSFLYVGSMFSPRPSGGIARFWHY
ncbi:MAG TPA: hypothetical protein VFQ61_36045 [Polyangiaceae bacterium]|nr:hypothetical protein [Polyangiaceae bacterium]